MVDWTLTVLRDAVSGSFSLMKSLIIIVIPLMVVMQIMTDYKWLEKLSEKTKFITDFFGISKEALIPLLIGVFAGISYGAGAIIFAKEKYALSKDDIFLAMCFLATFHGVVETTLIYWMIGVNPAVIIIVRFFIAITVTLFFKWRVGKRKIREGAALNGSK